MPPEDGLLQDAGEEYDDFADSSAEELGDDDYVMVEGNIGEEYLNASPKRGAAFERSESSVSRNDSSQSQSSSNYYGYMQEESRYFSPQTTRMRYRHGVALKGAAQLYNLGQISIAEKAALKELILSTDERVMAAVEVHEIDGDDEEILDTLKRIAVRALVEAQEMYSS